MRAAYFAALVLVCAAAVVSCTVDSGNGGGGGGVVCARAETKLRGCGLLTGTGSFGSCEEPVGAGETCEANCLLAATCDELKGVFCMQMFSGGLGTCVTTCETQNAFACGGGETVSSSSKCDGFDDCSNSADEAGCPTFDCGAGELVPAVFKCDGSTQCSTGADEDGCTSGVFTCDNGETISIDFKCDGGEECSDGSDEVGCPPMATLVCN
jgi:hypothetical protein